jgi:2-amino-4-hydroxy-6-hydroxymethyldihydropteridine diphosphokinase
MAEVFIGLGSNLDDRLAMLMEASRRLNGLLRAPRMSSVYETDPVGYEDQPRYLNAVITGTTDLTPPALLSALQRIEADLGRERPFPNAPRTIDLDFLLYDDLTLDTSALTLPHPRLHERAFVLLPLTELAPDLRHPRLARTMRELLAALGPITGIERITAGDAKDESGMAARREDPGDLASG